jgi:2-haloacid dehalogenase
VAVDAPGFAVAWRGGFFDLLTRVRSGELPRMNADAMHRRLLDDIAPSFPSLNLTPGDKDELTQAWHLLPAWPDAQPAIARLRERYVVVVLTVLSYRLVLDCSKQNGIDWDGIVSCEFLAHYKPDREAYLDAMRLLQVEPLQCLMIAAHAWDLEAARGAGLRTAYVPRPDERGPASGDRSPMEGVDLNTLGFDDLAGRLLG